MSQAAAQTEDAAAVRHVVYRDLLSLLPIASVNQATQFAVNLALCRNTFRADGSAAEVRRAMRLVLARLLNLRVTPDIAEVEPCRRRSTSEIEVRLSDKYGDRLGHIAGFFRRDDQQQWRVNLPERCALYGYRSTVGFYNGVLCQPIDTIDKFFLLSSRGQGGVSALSINGRDRDFLERFKEPVSPFVEPPLHQADLSGYRWNGRRFVKRTR